MSKYKPVLKYDSDTGCLSYKVLHGNNFSVRMRVRRDRRGAFECEHRDDNFVSDLRSVLDLDIGDDGSFDIGEASRYYKTVSCFGHERVTCFGRALASISEEGDITLFERNMFVGMSFKDYTEADHWLLNAIQKWFSELDVQQILITDIIDDIAVADCYSDPVDLTETVDLKISNILTREVGIDFDIVGCGIIYFPKIGATDGPVYIKINDEVVAAYAHKHWLILKDIPESITTATWVHKHETLRDYIKAQLESDEHSSF